MAHKHKSGKYQCSYCLRLYDTHTLADTCREEHGLIYVPFTQADLNSLITFLYTKEEKHLEGNNAARQLLKYRTLRQRLKE
jgi:hypothetical protein